MNELLILQRFAAHRVVSFVFQQSRRNLRIHFLRRFYDEVSKMYVSGINFKCAQLHSEVVVSCTYFNGKFVSYESSQKLSSPRLHPLKKQGVHQGIKSSIL